MSIENKVPMSDFTEVTDIADTARIIGLQDSENVKIPLQSLIAKTLSRVDEDILTIQDINVENGVTGFNPIGGVEQGDKRAVSGAEVFKDKTNSINGLSSKSVTESAVISYNEPAFTIKNEVENIANVTDLKKYEYSRSTFSGWGQPINIISSFNSVMFKIYNFDTNNPISKVGFRICENNYLGKELIKKEINIDIIGNYKDVVFYFNTLVINDNVNNLWIEFYTNGACSFPLGSDSDILRKLRYTIYTQPFGDFKSFSNEVDNGSGDNYMQFFYELGFVKKIAIPNSEFSEKIKGNLNANILLTKNVWLFPNKEYNIYNKNISVSDFNTSNNSILNYNTDFSGKGKGQQFERQYRLPISESKDNINLNLITYENGKESNNINHNIKVSDIESGNGVTRNILFIGDSTIKNGILVSHVNDTFLSDVMSINLLGTLTANGVKNEGRDGWGISDYYNKSTDNPFYNSDTSRFDFTTYMNSTSQNMANGDWVMIQLGINDVFSITSQEAANSTTDLMISRLNHILNSIKIYNENINIGISVTIPPANQDGFAYAYGTGQIMEIYRKIGLLTWQKKLIKEIDNDTYFNRGIYLIPTHSAIDTEYGFPFDQKKANAYSDVILKVPNNGVHPSDIGYKQMGDLYSGIIKFFG